MTRSFRPRPGRARPRGGRFTWRHGVAGSRAGVVAGSRRSYAPARAGQADESALDEAVAAFWAATADAEVAAATATAILATDPDIEAIWARLRSRPLLTRRTSRPGADSSPAATGTVVEHGYVVRVPERYDPAIRYPVIVYLHGGVARPKREDGTWWRREERLARDDAIVVAPASWNESLWWQDSQIENLAGVLDDLKRTWNLDENPRLPDRHLRRRDRRVLPRHEGDDAVGRVPGAQRPPGGARQPRLGRRRRDARHQPAQQAALRHQRRAATGSIPPRRWCPSCGSSSRRACSSTSAPSRMRATTSVGGTTRSRPWTRS